MSVSLDVLEQPVGKPGTKVSKGQAITPPPCGPADQPLYAKHVKVYPKAVSGPFRRIKWAVLIACLAVYYLAPWIRWDRGPGAPDQALLIDMAAPRAYFFWIEIWPQEVYYLTGLLFLGALGLFTVTALAGRVWCGYTCPQTVWTDLFLWVERLVEGDRGARMRLDQSPWSRQKALKKLAKHGIWLLIALATGGAWVLYFNDAPTFVVDFVTGQASAKQYFFVGLFTTTTYVLAGMAREQVCTYMCPWPRFQAAMLDRESLVVTYEAWRGEPRGKHKAGTSWEGRGDCVDCGQCIAACPTGIDIRDGLQLECIGCGLCIDACDDIMRRVGRPTGLVTLDSQANQDARAKGGRSPWRPIRPRTILYAVLLTAVAGLMTLGLATRSVLELTVLRDRAPLFVTLSDGSLRNGYTVRILNKDRTPRTYSLTLQDLPGATLMVQDVGQAEAGGAVALQADADSVLTHRVFVTAPRGAVATASTPLRFVLRDTATGGPVRTYETVFMGPAVR